MNSTRGRFDGERSVAISLTVSLALVVFTILGAWISKSLIQVMETVFAVTFTQVP